MVRFRKSLMSEGRRAEVVLLDGRRLDIVVQPRLTVDELLSIVASHCHLKEPDKQYFGLAFFDEREHCYWLQSDRRVLDHELPRKYSQSSASIVLCHLVKFFVESITQLAHSPTVELFFLQTRSAFCNGSLEVGENEFYCLAAHLLHIHFGDMTTDDAALVQLRRLLPLPKYFFAAQPSVSSSECEENIINVYRELVGFSRGAAVLRFMDVAEKQALYGTHFYEVVDKAAVPWCMAINSTGIYQLAPGDRSRPRKVFQWKHMENIYYRDKKFSIEVHDRNRVTHALSSFNMYEDAAREARHVDDQLSAAVADPSTQVSVSRRAFVPSHVHLHVYFCATAQLCKAIWSAAIAQHQFYLDRRTAAKKVANGAALRRDQLAVCLNRSIHSSGSLGSLLSTPRSSAASLTAAAADAASLGAPSLRSINSQRSDDERQRDADAYKCLKARKAELEAELLRKLDELKKTCISEAEVTGEVPKEIRRALGPGEAVPKIRQRVGTAFEISNDVIQNHTKADRIARLEADIAVQRKIVAAGERLANEKATNKSVRRKRLRDQQAAHQKLRENEQRLQQLRLSASKPDVSNALLSDDRAWPCFYGAPKTVALLPAKSAPTTPRGSVPDLSFDSADDASPSPRRAAASARPPGRPALPFGERVASLLQHSNSFPHAPPVNELDVRPRFPPDAELSRSIPSLPVYENVGYNSSSSYRSSYRTRNFPTLLTAEQQQKMVVRAVDEAPARLTIRHRTHSEHSIQSLAPSELDEPRVQPLPDYRRAAADVVDHDVGAYNVPRQRTSWSYRSIDQGLNKAHAVAVEDTLVAALPRYGDGRVGALVRKLSSCEGVSPTSRRSNGCPPQHYFTGSLDRRTLRQQPPPRYPAHGRPPPPPLTQPSSSSRQRELARRVSEQNVVGRARQQSPTDTLALDAAPFCGGGGGCETSFGSAVELTKPFETSDAVRYSASRLRSSSSSTSSLRAAATAAACRPLSPLACALPLRSPSAGQLRPPPPPYPGRASPNRSNQTATSGESSFVLDAADTFRDEMLAWYDGAATVKTATIV